MTTRAPFIIIVLMLKRDELIAIVLCRPIHVENEIDLRSTTAE